MPDLGQLTNRKRAAKCCCVKSAAVVCQWSKCLAAWDIWRTSCLVTTLDRFRAFSERIWQGQFKYKAYKRRSKPKLWKTTNCTEETSKDQGQTSETFLCDTWVAVGIELIPQMKWRWETAARKTVGSMVSKLRVCCKSRRLTTALVRY